MLLLTGLRRTVSAVQRLFNSASFSAPLTHSLVPERGTGSPTFTRATTETGQKWDEAGYLDFTALAGEIVFKGARRERNFVTNSENLTIGWTPNGTGSVTATTMVFTGAAGEGWNITGFTGEVGHVYQWQALMSVASGTHTMRFRVPGTALGEVTVTTTPTVFSFTTTSVSASAIFGIYNGATPSAGTVNVTQMQLVDITGETDQTTIRPYVSVGVESAPAYHGSMVDGVKCYDTDRSGNPISTSGSYPLVGYVPWEARTNSLIHARDLSNAAWVKVNCTGVKDAVGSDGVPNSASTLTATGANATCLQTLVLAAAARSYSVKIKRKTGTGTVSICRDGVTFTDITAEINSSTYTTVKIENTSVLNPICGIKLATSGDAVYVDWNQDEAGMFSTPPIATTTVAVARNASLLTYTGADVANIKTLACTFSRGVGVSSVGVAAVLTDGTNANTIANYMASATAATFAGVTASASQWSQAASNAYTPGTNSKMAQTWATNNIKMDKDGTAQTADTTATPPAFTQLQVGHQNVAYVFNGPVNHIYGWTRNLSQSELGAIDRA